MLIKLDENLPAVLIGQVPLGLLDFVMDSASQRLIGKPDHGGKRMTEMVSVEN